MLVSLIALAVNIGAAYANYRLMNRSIGMWSGEYGNIFLFFVEATAGIVFLIEFLQVFPFSKLSPIGQNSIYYYGVHIILIEAFSPKLLAFLSMYGQKWLTYVATFIFTGCICGLLYIMMPAYKKIIA